MLKALAWDSPAVRFSDLVGKTFSKVERVAEGYGDSDAIVFTVDDKEGYAMVYFADCCASCSIEDIAGDLQDLVGSPIVRAEENSNDEPTLDKMDDYDESFTWTFYRIQTAKGLVVIRWYGTSNGYYSESASFVKLVDSR